MTIWKLEWTRLIRTRRLIALLGAYLFFGLTGPLVAAYLSDILGQINTPGVKVELPDPVPADGIAQFISNASQIGLLIVVMVAASALAFDARREMAIFLRTRVPGLHTIVVPAYTVTTSAAIVSLLVGSLAAWYQTAVLLGGLPVGRFLLGVLLNALYLAFAVALVALVATLVRGVLATAGLALVLLILFSILGNFGAIGRWLPTTLSGAMAALVRDTNPGRYDADPGQYLPAALVSVVVTGLAVYGAIRLGNRREI
jgi:ABC-2 type transport system permease protein